MSRSLRIAAFVAPFLLAACVSVPSGPTVMALPGSTKSFEEFRVNDFECRQYAASSVDGRNPADAQAESAVKTAAAGAVVGAAAGALIGGREGAGTGAGAGLIAGTLGGVEAANSAAHGLQQRYDNAYVQCMYANGHRVPNLTGVQHIESRAAVPPPPPDFGR